MASAWIQTMLQLLKCLSLWTNGRQLRRICGKERTVCISSKTHGWRIMEILQGGAVSVQGGLKPSSNSTPTFLFFFTTEALRTWCPGNPRWNQSTILTLWFFTEGVYAERNFRRTEISPNGILAERNFRRGIFAERKFRRKLRQS